MGVDELLFIGLGLAALVLIALGCQAARAGRCHALLVLRDRAGRERRHRQERMSRIVHGAHDAWWELDLVNHTAFSSDRWRGMAGLEADQGAPGARRRAIHPKDRERICLELQAHLANPACTDYGSRFHQVRRDGSSVEVEACGRIERDPAGRALRMVGSTVNTSDSSILGQVRDQAASRRKPGSLRHPDLAKGADRPSGPLFAASVSWTEPGMRPDRGGLPGGSQGEYRSAQHRGAAVHQQLRAGLSARVDGGPLP